MCASQREWLMIFKVSANGNIDSFDALKQVAVTTALENVLSAGPDMPTYQADYDEASS
jgi:hypothetical protein